MVLIAVFLSFVASIVLWPVLYLLAVWFTVFFLTLIQGVNADLPAKFPQHFAVLIVMFGPAILLIERSIVHHWAGFAARHLWIKWCFQLLALPYRIPLGIFANARAFLLPSRGEMIDAVKILRLIDDMDYLETRRINLELPRSRRRRAVLHLLSMTELVRYQMRDGRLYLLLQNPGHVRSLIYTHVRFAKEDPPVRRRKRGSASRKEAEKKLPLPALNRFRNSANIRQL